MAEFHKLAQVDAFLKVAADTKHPLHDKTSWQQTRLQVEKWRRTDDRGNTHQRKLWDLYWVHQKRHRVLQWLHRTINKSHCYPRARVPRMGRRKIDKAVEAIIPEHSRQDDVVVFTDGSVKRGIKSGWGFTIRKSGVTQHEASGAIELTTSSMIMGIKAITEALKYEQDTQQERAVIVTDSMFTLQKVMNCFLGWAPIINNSALERLVWGIYPVPCRSRRQRASRQACKCCDHRQQHHTRWSDSPADSSRASQKRPQSSSYKLSILKEKGIQAGAGATSDMRGASRRHQNQMLMETLSINSLRTLQKMRTEQALECPACDDVRVHYRWQMTDSVEVFLFIFLKILFSVFFYTSCYFYS